MMHGQTASGFNWQVLYVAALMDAHMQLAHAAANELLERAQERNPCSAGHYMVTRHCGHYYAKAQNELRAHLRARPLDTVHARTSCGYADSAPTVATPVPPADPADSRRPPARPRGAAEHGGLRARTTGDDVPCGLVGGPAVGG
jgi:amidase